MIIYILYHGLDDPTQGILDAGGIFLYNTPNKAIKILDDMVIFKLNFSKSSQNDPNSNIVVSANGSNINSDHAILMDKFEALTRKINSEFLIIRKELKEMRDGRKDNQASQIYMRDDTPMCDPMEANYDVLQNNVLMNLVGLSRAFKVNRWRWNWKDDKEGEGRQRNFEKVVNSMSYDILFATGVVNEIGSIFRDNDSWQAEPGYDVILYELLDLLFSSNGPMARAQDGIFLCQWKYALDIICKAGLPGAKAAKIPMEQNHRLGLAKGR
ncbi:hypothetical protein Tco_0255369 [Tanacetum coccineum]